MVYYSKRALIDLRMLFKALLQWSATHANEPTLTYDEVLQYFYSLQNECALLATATTHKQPVYEVHKKYGHYVKAYKRNKRTTWYIIYNLRSNGSILIKRIMSNHITIK
ncbi:MAG: hypothetical protein LBU90_03340 [Bacteroidales bacterium]|jgi:predicted YcjX-like family ATPase|nr:hypothetical protein [Bacteroidales bacterium]